jgi:hypothetical protein
VTIPQRQNISSNNSSNNNISNGHTCRDRRFFRPHLCKEYIVSVCEEGGVRTIGADSSFGSVTQFRFFRGTVIQVAVAPRYGSSFELRSPGYRRCQQGFNKLSFKEWLIKVQYRWCALCMINNTKTIFIDIFFKSYVGLRFFVLARTLMRGTSWKNRCYEN